MFGFDELGRKMFIFSQQLILVYFFGTILSYGLFPVSVPVAHVI